MGGSESDSESGRRFYLGFRLAPVIGPLRRRTWSIEQPRPITATFWLRQPRCTRKKKAERKKSGVPAIIMASSHMLCCMRRLENTPSLNYVMTYFPSLPSEHCGLNCTAGKKKGKPPSLRLHILFVYLFFFGGRISPFCHGNNAGRFAICCGLAHSLIHSRTPAERDSAATLFIHPISVTTFFFFLKSIPAALGSEAVLHPAPVSSVITEPLARLDIGDASQPCVSSACG